VRQCLGDAADAMNERQRVLLYGRSVILGTVGASLEGHPHLEVIALSSPLPAVPELAALAPDVVIFDIDAARPEPALSLLEARPSLLLIGIDPESEQLLVLSGLPRDALTIDDLVRVIDRSSVMHEAL
jgi:hypothetical protein